MISKTVKEFRRFVPTWAGTKYDKHTERVIKETWWLLGIVPLYSRETLVATNL